MIQKTCCRLPLKEMSKDFMLIFCRGGATNFASGTESDLPIHRKPHDLNLDRAARFFAGFLETKI